MAQLKTKIKIKKFDVIRVPFKVEYVHPIRGRIFGLYAKIKCSRFLKFDSYGCIWYRLAIPKYEKPSESGVK